jgi:hypothetical protein
MCHCECRVKIHVKICKRNVRNLVKSVILVNPLQLTSVACLFDVKLFFYEFKFFNMIFFIAFVWLYTIYSKLYTVHSILYIVN